MALSSERASEQGEATANQKSAIRGCKNLPSDRFLMQEKIYSSLRTPTNERCLPTHSLHLFVSVPLRLQSSDEPHGTATQERRGKEGAFSIYGLAFAVSLSKHNFFTPARLASVASFLRHDSAAPAGRFDLKTSHNHNHRPHLHLAPYFTKICPEASFNDNVNDEETADRHVLFLAPIAIEYLSDKVLFQHVGHSGQRAERRHRILRVLRFRFRFLATPRPVRKGASRYLDSGLPAGRRFLCVLLPRPSTTPARPPARQPRNPCPYSAAPSGEDQTFLVLPPLSLFPHPNLNILDPAGKSLVAVPSAPRRSNWKAVRPTER